MLNAGGRNAFSFQFTYAILIHAAVQSPHMKGGEQMTIESIIFSIIVNITCGIIAAYVYEKFVK